MNLRSLAAILAITSCDPPEPAVGSASAAVSASARAKVLGSTASRTSVGMASSSARVPSAPTTPTLNPIPLATAAGKASTVPRTIVKAGDPTEIRLDDKEVYWIEPNAGLVRSAAKDGSSKAPRDLATGLSFPDGIAIDAQYVYVTEALDKHRLIRIKKSGGPMETLTTNKDGPLRAVVVDATRAYFVSEFEKAIYWMPKDSTDAKPAKLADHAGASAHLVLHETDLYWTVGSRGATGPVVFKVPLAGGAPTVIGSIPAADFPYDLAVDESDVYVTFGESDTIMKFPRAESRGPGALLVKGIKGQQHWKGIAIDATHVYWAEYGSGPVVRIAKDGRGQPLEVGSENGSGPVSVALDGTHVYWSRSGAIVRTPRIKQ